MSTHGPWTAGRRITAGRLRLSPGTVLFVGFRGSGQSISDSSVGEPGNAIAWDTPVMDWLNGWNSGQPTIYLAPHDGWYLLTGTIGLEDASTTARGCSWLVNESLVTGATARTEMAGTTFSSVSARSLPVELSEGDSVELAPFQDSGGSVNTTTGSVQPHIAIYWASPD